MTDQEKAALTPAEQQIVSELERIANRQMQVVERIDSMQGKIARGMVTAEDLKTRIVSMEVVRRKPDLFAIIGLLLGNIALTLTVAIALINHMLAH